MTATSYKTADLVMCSSGYFWPILLKKSAMVSTGEKYALEIEIFTLISRGFRAQISRSCAQKRHFQQSVRGQSGRTDFFNTIGQKRTMKLGEIRNAELKRSDQIITQRPQISPVIKLQKPRAKLRNVDLDRTLARTRFTLVRFIRSENVALSCPTHWRVQPSHRS